MKGNKVSKNFSKPLTYILIPSFIEPKITWMPPISNKLIDVMRITGTYFFKLMDVSLPNKYEGCECMKKIREIVPLKATILESENTLQKEEGANAPFLFLYSHQLYNE